MEDYELYKGILINTYHRLFVERVETVDVDSEFNFCRFVYLYFNTKSNTLIVRNSLF